MMTDYRERVEKILRNLQSSSNTDLVIPMGRALAKYNDDRERAYQAILSLIDEARIETELRVVTELEELYCNDENVLLDVMRITIAKLTKAKDGDDIK